MKKVDQLLKSMLGNEGFLTLRKHIFRQDSQTTLTPIDMYLPLLAVPRIVLSWLIQHINTIPVGESKVLKDVPGLGNIEMHLKRVGNDSYSADFIREGNKLHSFHDQTLPMVGGQIMGFTGDYSGVLDMSHKIMEHAGFAPPSVGDNSDELRNLVRTVGKLIDYLVAKQIGQPSSDIQPSDELEKKAYDPNTAKQGPSGFPVPVGPSGQTTPAAPSKKPQLKINQTAKEQDNIKQQSIVKAEYFKTKLSDLKKNNLYFVTEKNLLTKCKQCGIANFTKSEDSVTPNPCACFVDSFRHPFIASLAKANNGYTIQFSKNADEESVEAFMDTLFNRIK